MRLKLLPGQKVDAPLPTDLSSAIPASSVCSAPSSAFVLKLPLLGVCRDLGIIADRAAAECHGVSVGVGVGVTVSRCHLLH